MKQIKTTTQHGPLPVTAQLIIFMSLEWTTELQSSYLGCDPILSRFPMTSEQVRTQLDISYLLPRGHVCCCGPSFFVYIGSVRIAWK